MTVTGPVGQLQGDPQQVIVSFLGLRPYLGKPRSKNVVARASAEAEYIAMSLTITYEVT